MLYTISAYLLWGLFPAFFPLLEPAGAVEILAHRIVWCAVFMVVVISFTRGWNELRQASVKTWGLLFAAGVLVAGNWGIYVLAVNSGHVADAALGYFINPLFSVLLALLVLRETLRPAQIASVGIAAIGVAWLTFLTGEPPVLAMGLVITFGFYGLIKKQVPVTPIASLTAETLVVLPFALAYLLWQGTNGTSAFVSEGPSHTLLLMSAGIVTAVPLLLYGAGAKQLPLSALGMLQYITPTIQMFWALFVAHEFLSWQRCVGFTRIWIAVAIYLVDLLRLRPVRTRG